MKSVVDKKQHAGISARITNWTFEVNVHGLSNLSIVNITFKISAQFGGSALNLYLQMVLVLLV